MGKLHATNLAYKIPGTELIAVCSNRQHEIDAFKKEVSDTIKTYLNFDEMLDKEKSAEAIIICSNGGMHEEHLKKAMQAGLHIFIEKPFGTDLDMIKRMYDDVKKLKGNKTLYMGYNRRCDPSYSHMKDLIDSGKIGTPHFFRCTDLDPIMMAAGIVPGQEAKVILGKDYAKSSGGLFFDLSSHSFDMIRWVFNSEALTVHAKATVNVLNEYAEAGDYDTAAILMQLENKALGICHESRLCIHGYQIEMEVTGDKGILRLGTVPERNLVTIFDETGAVRECSDFFLERFEKSYEIEMNKFVECINKGINGYINELDGFNAAKMAWACKQSALTGKEIKLSDL